jgi:hypothetical protein
MTALAPLAIAVAYWSEVKEAPDLCYASDGSLRGNGLLFAFVFFSVVAAEFVYLAVRALILKIDGAIAIAELTDTLYTAFSAQLLGSNHGAFRIGIYLGIAWPGKRCRAVWKPAI